MFKIVFLSNFDILLAASKFSRSFSIVGRKKQGLDDDVQQLVDACRRYQVCTLILSFFIVSIFQFLGRKNQLIGCKSTS